VQCRRLVQLTELHVQELLAIMPESESLKGFNDPTGETGFLCAGRLGIGTAPEKLKGVDEMRFSVNRRLPVCGVSTATTEMPRQCLLKATDIAPGGRQGHLMLPKGGLR